jgi:hypothetical protein
VDAYDEFDGSAAPRALSTNHSGHWGLAALLVGCLLILFFPISLLVIGVGVQSSYGAYGQWDVSGLQLADTIAHVTVYCLMGLGMLGLLAGLIGLISGLVRRQPIGLPLVGLFLCLGGLVFSVMLLIAVNRVADDMWRSFQFQDRRFNQPFR